MSVMELLRGSGTSPVTDLSPNGGYERGPDTFHLEFDPHAEPVGDAIVTAASLVHNTEPTELSPLGATIDPDALADLLFGHGTAADERLQVTFTYEDLEITVANDGDVWLSWA